MMVALLAEVVGMNRHIKQFGFCVALNLVTISILTTMAVLAIIRYSDWWGGLNHYYTLMWSTCKGSKSKHEFSSDGYHGDSTHDNARRVNETDGIVTNYNTQNYASFIFSWWCLS